MDKPIFVVDTNIWIKASAQGATEGPENNSELDIACRNEGVEPEKLRGKLILSLAFGHVAIPEIVVKELKHILATQTIFSRKNRENIAAIVDAIGKDTVKTTPTREEVIRQANAVETLAQKAQTIVEKYRTAGVEIPKDWVETLGTGGTGGKDAWKHAIRGIPETKTWSKIAHLSERAVIARGDLPKSGETTQRNLMKDAVALRKINDAPDAPRDPSISERNKKIADLETEAKGCRPFMISDWEIYFCAQRLDAKGLLSKDGDMEIIAQETTGMPKIDICKSLGGAPATMAALIDSLKTSLKEGKKTVKKLNRRFEEGLSI